MKHAIELDHVTKIYRRYSGKQFSTLKSALLQRSILRDLQPNETFPALTDVSFTVPKGCTFGVIGRNGSGKSTALKLVAGITKPTSGTVTVDGRISALIELGAGFHPEISGRENVYINGIMLGLSKREISERFDEIVDFAELREFIDAPVKTYSSGMYMRLGFAVAIHVNPDVLLVDEVLAVGDEGFTHKCLDKFGEFRRRGKTILLVTHSLSLVERFCDEAVWIDHGHMQKHGDPKRVVGAYLTAVEEGEEELLASATARAVEEATKRADAARAEKAQVVQASVKHGAGTATDSFVEGPAKESQAPTGETDAVEAGSGELIQPEPALIESGAVVHAQEVDVPASEPDGPPENMFDAVEGRWGSREVEVTDVSFIGADGKPSFVFHTGQPMAIRMRVRATEPTDDFVFGIGLFNAEGVCCYGTNTYIEEMEPASLEGEAEVTFAIDGLDLVEGTYKVDIAAHKRDGAPYDYHRLLYTFRVKSRIHDVGIHRPRHHWQFTPNVQFKAEGEDKKAFAHE